MVAADAQGDSVRARKRDAGFGDPQSGRSARTRILPEAAPRPGTAASGYRPAGAVRAPDRPFYLRRSVDSEKVTVYRLFHDGLGEQLTPAGGGRTVYRAILEVTGPVGRLLECC